MMRRVFYILLIILVLIPFVVHFWQKATQWYVLKSTKPEVARNACQPIKNLMDQGISDPSLPDKYADCLLDSAEKAIEEDQYNITLHLLHRVEEIPKYKHLSAMTLKMLPYVHLRYVQGLMEKGHFFEALEAIKGFQGFIEEFDKDILHHYSLAEAKCRNKISKAYEREGDYYRALKEIALILEIDYLSDAIHDEAVKKSLILTEKWARERLLKKQIARTFEAITQARELSKDGIDDLTELQSKFEKEVFGIDIGEGRFKLVASFNPPNPGPDMDGKVVFKVRNGSGYPLLAMFRGPDGADIMLKPKEEKELTLQPGWYAQVVTSKDAKTKAA